MMCAQHARRRTMRWAKQCVCDAALGVYVTRVQWRQRVGECMDRQACGCRCVVPLRAVEAIAGVVRRVLGVRQQGRWSAPDASRLAHI